MRPDHGTGCKALFIGTGFGASGTDTRLDIRTVDPATGVPTDTVLGTSSVIPVSELSSPDWETARFSPGVPVVAGQKYALGLKPLGSDYVYWRGSRDTNTCPDSKTFFRDGGLAFEEESYLDAHFRLYEAVPKAAPVGVDDSYAASEYGTLNVDAPGVLANDTDADGDALSAALVDNADHGTLALNPNGSFSYTSYDHYEGTDAFVYEVFDGDPDSDDTAVVRITVSPDDAPPSVSISSPEDSASVSGALNLMADASDDGRVSRVEFLVDRHMVGVDDSAPYEDFWNSETFSEGSHEIKARAFDAAGNFSVSEARSVMVDNYDPTSSITSGPAQDNLVRNTAARFSFASTDGNTFECQLDARPVEVCASGKSYTGLAQGRHTLKVWAVGTAGGTSDLEATPSVRT